jgi:hypothetical protein
MSALFARFGRCALVFIACITMLGLGGCGGTTSKDISGYFPNVVVIGLTTTITVNGNNFGREDGASFKQGTTTVATTSIQGVSYTQLNVTVPTLKPGVYTLVLTDSRDDTSAAVGPITVVQPVTPTITALSPNLGSSSGDTRVTVTGTGFSLASKVKFGTVDGDDLKVISDSSLQITSPAGTGMVQVAVIALGGTSAATNQDLFTYTTAPTIPSIADVSPNTGPTAGGTSVEITGSGFTGTEKVSFGSVLATNVVVVSDNEVTATSPAGTNTVDVVVENALGSSTKTSADKFTYAAPAAPTITSVSPSNQGGGTPVLTTITGTGFSGATALAYQNGTGSVSGAFAVISDTEIQCTPSASFLGVYDIRITTASGTSAITTADKISFF